MEWLGIVVSASVAFIVYVNTLSADFAYDDSRAILKNQDLLPDTPWTNLLFDDFWGTPLTHSGSHKSYRPLCVATFRLNYLVGGHSPVGYHLVNVLLHALVTGLFAYVVQTTLYAGHRRQSLAASSTTRELGDNDRRWMQPGGQVGTVAGLLFATHPIHTEAVAGVVGRADVLACLFFLLSFESYARYCRARDETSTGDRKQRLSSGEVNCSSTKTSAYKQVNGFGYHHNGVYRNGTTPRGSSEVSRRDANAADVPDSDWRHGRSSTRRWIYVAGSVLFTAASMLSKEHGVTVLAVCLVYDAFVVSRLRFKELLTVYQKQHRGLHEGFFVLSSTAAVLIGCRLLFMGCRTPEFSPSDNPASDSPVLVTRVLTFLFLPAFNGWLLLCPSWLSFDWSMGSIPLVETVLDVRNGATALFYVGLAVFAWRVLLTANVVPTRSTSISADGAIAADRSPSSSTSGSRRNSPPVRTPVKMNGNGSHHLQLPSSWSSPSVVIGAASRLNDCCSCDSSSSVDSEHSTATNGSGSVRSSSQSRLDRKPISRDAITAADDGDDDVNEWFVLSPRVALVSLALIVVPFVPATNLFFYVGFVVAERVLYIPSLGLCVLVADGIYRLTTTSNGPTTVKNHRWTWPASARRRRGIVVRAVLVGLVATFSAKTIARNVDWQTEESLYRSGISVNPAKAWGNLANVLNAQGKSLQAESAYKSALGYRSNMADVHYNLGILYQEQGRHSEAIQSYKLAIQCRPRLTLAYLNLGIVYANVGMKIEAETIYKTCSEIDISGLKDPRLHEQTKVSALYNLGRLLDDQGRHQEAVDVYLNAVNKLPSHYAPQSLYNMLGEAYSKLSDFTSAERWYRKALKVKPDHIPAHLTLAKLYQRQGWLDKAEQLFLKAQQIEPKDASVYQHYGQFLTDTGRHQEAVTSYLSAAQLAPTDFELIFNTASALRQAGRNLEAENFYKRAVLIRPEMALAHMNLGAMLHFNGRLLEAEASYLTALRLQPNDEVTTTNLNKLRNKLRGVSGRV